MRCGRSAICEVLGRDTTGQPTTPRLASTPDSRLAAPRRLHGSDAGMHWGTECRPDRHHARRLGAAAVTRGIACLGSRTPRCSGERRIAEPCGLRASLRDDSPARGRVQSAGAVVPSTKTDLRVLLSGLGLTRLAREDFTCYLSHFLGRSLQ